VLAFIDTVSLHRVSLSYRSVRAVITSKDLDFVSFFLIALIFYHLTHSFIPMDFMEYFISTLPDNVIKMLTLFYNWIIWNGTVCFLWEVIISAFSDIWASHEN